MNNYTPIFGKIVDSSLWEEPLHVRVLFMTMLVRQDYDHVVRIADHHLRRVANLSDDEVMDGLKVLSEPDTKSKFPQEYDGRRIRRVADGWFILNAGQYQDEMKRLNRQAKWARNKRNQRARKAALKTLSQGVTKDESDRRTAEEMDQI